MSRILTALGLARRSVTMGLTWDTLWNSATEFGRSASGVTVSREKAMTVSAWWRAVDIRSGALARIGPPQVLRRSDGGYAPDPAHPAHRIVARFEFAGMTAFDFYKSRGIQRINCGSSYAYVDRVPGTATPIRLIPLDPSKVQPFRENGIDGYLYTPEDVNIRPRKMPASDVWHFRGMSWDGKAGYVTYIVARDTLGAAIAMRDHGSRFFRNGAIPGMVFEHPDAGITQEEKDRFLQNFARATGGVDNAFKALILEDGFKAVQMPTQMTAEAAQLVESRIMEIREVSNFIGVPSHYLGDPNGRAYNSQEQDEQGFLNHTVEGDLVSCEQELARVLLTEDEKDSGDVVIEFDRDRLIVADVKSRAEADKAATAGVPWKTLDEVRVEHGYRPLPNGRGADLIIPINLQQAAKPGSEADPAANPPPAPPEDAPPPADPGDTPASRAVKAFVVATRARMLRRLTSAARAAGKHPAKFGDWLDGFVAEHVGVVREAFAPADGVLDAKAAASSLLAEVRGTLDAVYSTAKPAAFSEALEAALVRLES